MLYRHGTTPVHRLPAQVKIVALLVFVLAVVVIPPEAFWAYFLAGCLLVGVMILAELPGGFVARRMIVEIPILVFALLLPFFGQGETTEVFGLTLSVEGLWGAWTILAKATLGVGASIIVSATTTIPDLLRGLDRIRVPRVLTAIAGFMVRYLDIVTGEFSRRRVAMAARGYEPRWVWQNGPLAQSAGSLFIRSFERGERVHQAMVARGFSGRMPVFGDRPATTREWWIGLSVSLAAVLLAVLSLTVLR
ncbi:MAG: cobalt ECF transporter T component CbiQ [Acidimicrobiia bacterium]